MVRIVEQVVPGTPAGVVLAGVGQRAVLGFQFGEAPFALGPVHVEREHVAGPSGAETDVGLGELLGPADELINVAGGAEETVAEPVAALFIAGGAPGALVSGALHAVQRRRGRLLQSSPSQPGAVRTRSFSGNTSQPSVAVLRMTHRHCGLRWAMRSWVAA